MKKEIFRKVQLERLSSPEQLDTLIRITSPKAWLALIAIIALLVTAILWGIFGSIPTKVHGQGIMVSPGGIHKVVSIADGQITDVSVTVDQFVQKGNVVARIGQPELVDQINDALSDLEEMKKHPDQNANQIRLQKAKIQGLRDQLTVASQVVSPVTGKVIDVNVSLGDLVHAGTSIISVEESAKKFRNLEVAVYVPVQVGENLSPGMDVNVLPVSAKKEESGFILGKVTSISEFPVTFQSMMQKLGNKSLVQALTGNQPMMEVHIDLMRSNGKEGAYRWSTGKTSPIKVSSGTLCRAAITIKERSPISLVLPIGK